MRLRQSPGMFDSLTARRGARLTALLLAAFCLLWTGCARADGFFFGATPAPPYEYPAPADVFELEAASALRDAPVFAAKVEDGTVILTPRAALPDGAAWSLTADGGTVEAERQGNALRVTDLPGRIWLTLTWTAGGEITAQYLIQDGTCELWTASATQLSGTLMTAALTHQGGGGYTLSMSLEQVAGTTVYYDADGELLGAVLLGDRRTGAAVPLTIQYDHYGRAVSITATDLAHTYTYSRAQGVWMDEDGLPAVEALSAFQPQRHPAPAAKSLSHGVLHETEATAGVDREAFLASAPSLSGLSATAEGISFISDAETAEVAVDNLRFSSARGSLRREDDAFYAEVYAEGMPYTLTLTRGGVTAVWENGALSRVSDRRYVWTADGALTVSLGAASASYNKNGRLTSVSVESADGATLTYNAAGRLTGWAMDEYSWTRDGSAGGVWRTTAVNEKGNVVHPTVKAPAAVRLEDYPAITIQK